MMDIIGRAAMKTAVQAVLLPMQLGQLLIKAAPHQPNLPVM